MTVSGRTSCISKVVITGVFKSGDLEYFQNHGSYVSQLFPKSFLANKEWSPTCTPKFERKNKSYRCSSFVVSKMHQESEEEAKASR